LICQLIHYDLTMDGRSSVMGTTVGGVSTLTSVINFERKKTTAV